MIRLAGSIALGAVVMYAVLFTSGYTVAPQVIYDDAMAGNETPTLTPTVTEGTDTETEAAVDGSTPLSGPTPTATATASPTPTPAGLQPEQVEQLIYQEINDRRDAHNRRPLRHERNLRKIARFHSGDMATEGYFSHEDPDGRYYEDRYQRFNYDCKVQVSATEYASGGETIAYTYYGERVRTNDGTVYYDTPAELATGFVNQWFNSTTHRETILQTYWENVGVGVATKETSEGLRVYATMNFC